MKFLCERCKTRYSIADDRVRGKVLKIRCKNCEFVISVREGMTDEDVGRNQRPTTMAPMGSMGPPAPPENPSAPSSLDDEWYVSIDGNQTGPFSLPQAQAWVTKHPLSADLHCWCEGFADWQAVEDVSQLRGLRKEAAAPKVPPPRPKPASVASPVVRPAAASATAAKSAKSGKAATTADDDPFARLSASSASRTELAKSEQPANRNVPVENHNEEDDLSIGEVSRVVNLADLAKSAARHKPQRVGTRTPANGIAALANGTGPVNLQAPDAVTAALAMAAKVSQAEAQADLPHDAPAVAVASHQRGKLGLIIGGVVIVSAVVLTTVLVLRSGDSEDGRVAIGGVGQYDGIGVRPDDPIRRTGLPDPKGSNAGTDIVKVPVRRWDGGPKIGEVPRDTTGNSKIEATGLPGALTALDPSEIEAEVSKKTVLLQRCKDRAMREDPFFDVKKVGVTMSVDKSGSVTEVSLASDASKNQRFTQCLNTSIKGFRFRASTKGIDTRINVVFQ